MTTVPRAAAGPAGAARVRSARTKIAEVVVVCAKCAKRQGLRPRALRDLVKGAAKEARREARREAGREAGKDGARGKGGKHGAGGKVRVLASGCLGPCPKRAVAVATGASLAAGRVLLLDPAGPRPALAAILAGGGRTDFGPIAELAAGHPDESPRSP